MARLSATHRLTRLPNVLARTHKKCHGANRSRLSRHGCDKNGMPAIIVALSTIDCAWPFSKTANVPVPMTVPAILAERTEHQRVVTAACWNIVTNPTDQHCGSICGRVCRPVRRHGCFHAVNHRTDLGLGARVAECSVPQGRPIISGVQTPDIACSSIEVSLNIDFPFDADSCPSNSNCLFRLIHRIGTRPVMQGMPPGDSGAGFHGL